MIDVTETSVPAKTAITVVSQDILPKTAQNLKSWTIAVLQEDAMIVVEALPKTATTVENQAISQETAATLKKKTYAGQDAIQDPEVQSSAIIVMEEGILREIAEDQKETMEETTAEEGQGLVALQEAIEEEVEDLKVQDQDLGVTIEEEIVVEGGPEVRSGAIIVMKKDILLEIVEFQENQDSMIEMAEAEGIGEDLDLGLTVQDLEGATDQTVQDQEGGTDLTVQDLEGIADQIVQEGVEDLRVVKVMIEKEMEVEEDDPVLLDRDPGQGLRLGGIGMERIGETILVGTGTV